ncbi:alpha/beta-hydrolase [Viridothelium virens]|uniref:Alpha/beta-hydrolase n=1 Tax=Viridothelium virens TaxID=1048519 RepID=A0A6A6HP50_VIRVR|nr:alpha/beta-hydrolase [Viridothelium virens]
MATVAPLPKIKSINTLDSIRKATITYQPFKALWVLLAVSTTLIRLPLWTLLYLLPSLRPNPHWTFRQALGTRIVRLFLYQSSLVEVKTPTSLSPGAEKSRFVTIDPSSSPRYASLFKGILNSDPAIRPAPLGATWYPQPPSSPSSPPAGDTVLHLHGGAFVLGDGRTADAGFAAKSFLNARGAHMRHVLAPQYRLSSNRGGHFPAALQDAVSAYAHLVLELGVPASRVIVSGDSAGGNLVIALLRYLAEYGEEVGLAAPGAAWLWSPWVDPMAARDPGAVARNPRQGTDFLTPGFGYWGAWSYVPAEGAVVEPGDAYVGALGRPFATRTPVWVQTGSAEVLYEEDKAFAEQMKGIDGNRVECHVVQHAPHDICLIGHLLGWGDQALECAKRAGEFVRRARKAV